MVAVRSYPPMPEPPEQRVRLDGVSWSEYSRLLEMFGDRPSMRLTYLCGQLEIMTTSALHELLKTRIARLVEAWSEELGIDLRGAGQTTFRAEAKQRGLEADECYTLGERPSVPGPQGFDRPDIAIEVVVSSPLVDKLAVYSGLEIPEVWLFEKGAFRIFVLEGESYREQARSVFFPSLDFALLVELAREANQLEAVRALRARIRG